MKYLFTIVVPVYNVELYLKKCIESLLEQKNAEILLVDDGSKDHSGQICDEYGKLYSNIKALHKTNGGLSSARNVGIENASGDYVLFVDSDDYIEKDTVKILERTLEAHGYPDAVVFDGIEDNGSDLKVLRGKTPLSGQCASGENYLLEHYKNGTMSVEAWLYLYKKEFLNLNRLRFREGILHEDVEFTPRAMLAAGRVVEISDRLYHYVVRENSISTTRNKEKNIRDLFQTLKELDELAGKQEPELGRWMKNAVLNSYLNMVYDARMYRKEYRDLFDKKFLKGKSATWYNRFRAGLCGTNVWLYCAVNDIYKKLKK